MEIKGNFNEQTSFWILSLRTANIIFQLSSVLRLPSSKSKYHSLVDVQSQSSGLNDTRDGAVSINNIMNIQCK